MNRLTVVKEVWEVRGDDGVSHLFEDPDVASRVILTLMFRGEFVHIDVVPVIGVTHEAIHTNS